MVTTAHKTQQQTPIHLPTQPHLLPDQTLHEQSVQFARDFGMADFAHWREVNPFEHSFGPSPVETQQPWPNPNAGTHTQTAQLSKGLVATIDSNGYKQVDVLSNWLVETEESREEEARRASIASSSFAPEPLLQQHYYHQQQPPPPPPLIETSSNESTHHHSSSSSSLPLSVKPESNSPPNLAQQPPASIAPSAVFLPAQQQHFIPEPLAQPHFHPPSHAFSNLSITQSLPPPPPLPHSAQTIKRPRPSDEALAVPPIKKRGRPPKKQLPKEAESGAEGDEDEESKLSSLERNRLAAQRSRVRKKQMIRSLESDVNEWVAVNQALRSQVGALEQQVYELRAALIASHGPNCGCAQNSTYFAGLAPH